MPQFGGLQFVAVSVLKAGQKWHSSPDQPDPEPIPRLWAAERGDCNDVPDRSRGSHTEFMAKPLQEFSVHGRCPASRSPTFCGELVTEGSTNVAGPLDAIEEVSCQTGCLAALAKRRHPQREDVETKYRSRRKLPFCTATSRSRFVQRGCARHGDARVLPRANLLFLDGRSSFACKVAGSSPSHRETRVRRRLTRATFLRLIRAGECSLIARPKLRSRSVWAPESPSTGMKGLSFADR